jgi:hypothetical protein
MRTLNLKGLALLSFVIGTCLVALNSCRTDHTLSPAQYAKIYIPQARKSPVEYNVVTGIDSIQIFNYQAVYGGPGKPKRDITVQFSVDTALVDSFNIRHFKSYPLLPKSNYQLSGLSTSIPAGEDFSPVLTLKIDGSQSIPENKYLLPITITTTDGGIPVNKALRTAYFVFNARQIKPINTAVIITGFLVNPSGSDVPQIGDSRSYSDNNVSFTFKGGQEYVQLMALQDIDFSQVPYSLVVGRYGDPMTDGWATGGQVSFKFDLTQGTVAAGTFFYVGEGQMVINGYSDQGLSTDISNANWIRNIDPNVDGTTGTLAGDGFGSSTTGLLTNGEANATGLAVFKGTNITASSVPADVVFYGGSVGTAYQPPYGYKVPLQSDLYSAVNSETGDQQSLFGQGTNTFSVSGANGNETFVQMGGAFSGGHIFQPRTHPALITLGQNSTLDDLEGGAATQYIKGR